MMAKTLWRKLWAKRLVRPAQRQSGGPRLQRQPPSGGGKNILSAAIIFATSFEALKIIEAIMLHPARVYKDEWSVSARLAEVFGATRADFLHIVREIVGAMADSVDDDPDFTSGMFAHIHGVRNTRGTFRKKGWKRLTLNGNSLVKHPEIELMLGYQTVDLAASDDHEPKAVSGKGAGAKRVIDEAQATLFSLLDFKDCKSPQPINTGLWHLCVSVKGEDVRAEVSLSSGVTIEAEAKRGNFGRFIERIYLIKKGDWADLGVTPIMNDEAVEFEPLVKRK